ncbi:MAG: alpha/beta fold hydrolase [Alphaproteobacteria bacterium]
MQTDRIDLALQHSPKGVGFRTANLSDPWAGESLTPIVFQHGLGLNSLAWLPWMRRVGGERPMVSIDMRGHGGSASMWEAPSLEVSDYAGDILDVLDMLKIDRCHFVGESFGGTTGLYLGIHAPDRIETITVASTGWRGDMVNNISDWPATLKEVGGLKRWSDAIKAGSFDPETVPAPLIDWAEAAHLSVEPEVVIGIVLSLRQANLGPDLEKLTMPILNLVAGQSPFVDTAQHGELGRHVPNYRQVDFPLAKHRLFMTHAADCADEFVKHIRSAS